MVQKLGHEFGKHLAVLQSLAVLREGGRVPDRVVGRKTAFTNQPVSGTAPVAVEKNHDPAAPLLLPAAVIHSPGGVASDQVAAAASPKRLTATALARFDTENTKPARNFWLRLACSLREECQCPPIQRICKGKSIADGFTASRPTLCPEVGPSTRMTYGRCPSAHTTGRSRPGNQSSLRGAAMKKSRAVGIRAGI
jgi:hypothetical protein